MHKIQMYFYTSKQALMACLLTKRFMIFVVRNVLFILVHRNPWARLYLRSHPSPLDHEICNFDNFTWGSKRALHD